MNFYKISFITALIVLLAISALEAKKHKKHTRSAGNSNSKTKTKWSSSAEMGGRNSGQLATEEHGYYVKRTFLPLNATDGRISITTPRSPPYLGIPIAWFPCEGDACIKVNTAAISGSAAALLDGFLCDDDCTEPYAPICGRTPSELAVFYNKCKLNVAKCRTHGLWLDVPLEECQKTNPKEVAYAERKFKSSPFFRDTETVVTTIKKQKPRDDSSEEDTILDVALLALDKIGNQVAEAEAAALGEAASTTVKSEVSAPLAKPAAQAQEQQSMQVEGKPEKESRPIVAPPVEEEKNSLAAAAVKPVKTADMQRVAENSVNKPVESVKPKPAESVVAQQAASDVAKPVTKK